MRRSRQSDEILDDPDLDDGGADDELMEEGLEEPDADQMDDVPVPPTSTFRCCGAAILLWVLDRHTGSDADRILGSSTTRTSLITLVVTLPSS